MADPTATAEPPSATATAEPPAAPQPEATPGNEATIPEQPVQATGATPATGPDTPELQHPDAPQQDIPDQPMQKGPVALIPQKRSGLGGIVDDLRNALAGTRGSDVYINPETGEHYLQHPYLTGKQQWLKIGSEALKGAARGLAYGKGAGNMGRGIDAAVEGQINDQEKVKADQTEDAQRNFANQRTARLDHANAIMQQAQIAEMALRQSREGVKATQEGIDWAEKQEKYYSDQPGAFEIGTFKDATNIHELKQRHPSIWDDHLKDNAIRTVPQYNGDGTSAGAKFFYVPPGPGNDLMPEGTKLAHFVASTDPGKPGHLEYVAPSDPIKRALYDNYQDAATKALGADADRLAKLQKEQTGTRLDEAKIVTEKTQPALNRAHTAEAYAAARKNDAEARKADSADITSEGGQALVDMIGTGHMETGRMAYLIAKRPELFTAVHAKYPDFDTSKIGGYADAVKKFNGGEIGQQMNNGATALKHMKELLDLNTTGALVPFTTAHARYKEKLTKLTGELGQFYKENNIPGAERTLNSLGAPTTWERDAAIRESGKSMSDKFDSFKQQWKNAAPSAAYLPRMPDIDPQAKAARAALDPSYRPTVYMKAPNGAVSEVPEDQVEHFKSLGAVVEQ